MKSNSDNFRSSAVIDIIDILNKNNAKIIIYEPNLKQKEFMGNVILNDLNEFKQKSDVIVANRMTDDLIDVAKKVYSRDLFNVN